MTEQQIQSKIIAFLEGKGFYVIKIITAGKAGEPDLVACSPVGGFLAIEVKTEKGKLAPLQAEKLKRIQACGGTSFVAYGYEDFLNKFRRTSV